MSKDQNIGWVRSTYCGGANTTCVEVAMGVDQVGVRDGKENAGPVLLFSAREWRDVVRGVRDDDFSG